MKMLCSILLLLLAMIGTPRTFAACSAQGGSPEKCYNQALADKEKGDLPAASLALRRSLALDPTLIVARHEFQEVLGKIGLPIVSSWQEELLSRCSPEKIALIGMVIGWSATWGIVALFFLGMAPSIKRPKKWGLFLLLLLLSLIGHALSVLGVIIDPRYHARHEVILMPKKEVPVGVEQSSDRASTTALRAAPTDVATIIAQLPTASSLTLLSQHGAWSYVRTATGAEGWVPSANLEPLIPSE
jgi:hypothetical protein